VLTPATIIRSISSALRIPPRGWVAFAHDIVMAALSVVLAMLLRVGGQIMDFFTPQGLAAATLLFTAIAAVVFVHTGLYRGVWRYASVTDLLAIARAVTIAVVVFVLVMFVWTRLEPLPRSVPLIHWLVLTALLGGPRFLYRIAKDRRYDRRREAEAGTCVPVVLVGADAGAELFIRALRREPQRIYQVVGIVEERPKRIGQRIHGVPVLGTVESLPAVVEGLRARGKAPQRLVLTTETMAGARVRTLLDVAAGLGMTLARLPRLTEFKSGDGEDITVRPIDVEDLLGRPQTPLDRAPVRALVAGRRVAVTGAGGCIGGELVRQIGALAPSVLVLIDHAEHNLYTIEQETREHFPDVPCVPLLVDVRDRPRVRRVLAEQRPDLVFHAAALKHVPLVEANPIEGVLTNVFGSINVADACAEVGVAVMLLISTDKAINPSSVMGAAKRIAERYCQAMDRRTTLGHHTRYVTVRFGNVLGSSGSVVPLFQKQLAAGGPLTVTHPEMKRYFMTVGEAVELVLHAAALGGRPGAGDGRIFVLDMGEPVRILDLARQMIRLGGFRPDVDVGIEFIGLRPGEKLFEELFHRGEGLVATECAGLLLAAPDAADRDVLAPELDALAAACAAGEEAAVLRCVRRLVPEYRQGETVPPRMAAVR
jgi:O-antigen biosynthesis protein WbqV